MTGESSKNRKESPFAGRVFQEGYLGRQERGEGVEENWNPITGSSEKNQIPEKNKRKGRKRIGALKEVG